MEPKFKMQRAPRPRPDPPENFVTNGSFTVDADGWVAYEFAGTPTLTHSTEQAHSASHSLKVENAEPFDGAYIPFSVPAGNAAYTASCWIFSLSAASYFMELTDFVDESAASDPIAVPANSWVRLSYTVTIDATTDRNFAIRNFDAEPAAFYVDDVEVIAA